jgi:hypothetical protein
MRSYFTAKPADSFEGAENRKKFDRAGYGP